MAKKKSKTVVQKKTTKKVKSSGGHEAGRWNGHKFTISPQLIRGFTDLKIKGSSEMDKKDDDAQGYVSRKGASPTEVSLTVHLSALTGCDVRKEALQLVKEAREGKFDYFYVGGSKLVPYKLMLIDAQVSEVGMSSGKGKWVSAEVSLSMKQCNKDGSSNSESSDGDSSGGSGGSGKDSAYYSTPTTSRTTPTVSSIASATKPAATQTTGGTVGSTVGSVGSILGNQNRSTLGQIAAQAQNKVNQIKKNIAQARTGGSSTTTSVIRGGGVNRNMTQ